MDRRFLLGGIINRKERLGLTWRGRFLVAGLVLALGTFLVVGIHPFLAPTKRVPAGLLVIEGWSPPVTLGQAAAEFRSGKYEQAILVRPVLDVSDQYQSGRFYGQWISHLLVENGLPEDKLVTLFPIVARKDRTYHSALEVKKWCASQGLSVTSLNVATAGPHARRSRLLYEKTFGADVSIGIIAMQSPDYDPRHWWQTSEGVREVLGESIAYFYARVFFWPSQDQASLVAAGAAKQ